MSYNNDSTNLHSISTFVETINNIEEFIVSVGSPLVYFRQNNTRDILNSGNFYIKLQKDLSIFNQPLQFRTNNATSEYITIYNNRIGFTKNGSTSFLGGANIGDLNDVDINNLQSGHILMFDGVSFKNIPSTSPNIAFSTSFYFTNEDDTTYKVLSDSVSLDVEDQVTLTTNTSVYFQSPALYNKKMKFGGWNFYFYLNVADSEVNDNTVTIQVYKNVVQGDPLLEFTSNVISDGLNQYVSVEGNSTIEMDFDNEGNDSLIIGVKFNSSNALAQCSLYVAGTIRPSWMECPIAVAHNNIFGLQGGTNDQYYHINKLQYDFVTNYLTHVLQNTVSPENYNYWNQIDYFTVETITSGY